MRESMNDRLFDGDTLATTPSGLYLVATPIGNLADITLRALHVLGQADLVVCEDTRRTGRLLQAHGLRKPLAPYTDHNAPRQRPVILEHLARGERVALVSDAGTPLVSDPGYKLVQACLDLGIPVTPIPGACAAVTALTVSGLPPDSFCFCGFAPPRADARRAFLQKWKQTPATLIFYETAPRLCHMLAACLLVFGDRPAAIARELTKLFEEVRRDRLSVLHAHMQDSAPPKGEIVLLIAPPDTGSERLDDSEIDSRLQDLMTHMGVRDASSCLASETGLSKKSLYARALILAGKAPQA